jgi:hypothetical protein
VSSARPAGYLQATVISYLSLDLYLEGETVKLSPLCISLLCCRTTTNLLHAVNINKIVTRLAIKQFFCFFFCWRPFTFSISDRPTKRSGLSIHYLAPNITPLVFRANSGSGNPYRYYLPGEQFTPKSHFILFTEPRTVQTINHTFGPFSV